MRVLSISTDAEILRPGSPVAARMASYAEAVDELHIIVYTRTREHVPQRLQLAPKLFVYPTRTPRRLAFFRVAYDLAVQVLSSAPSGTSWVLTTQDPFETGLVGAMIRRRFDLAWQVQVHTDFLNPAFQSTATQRMRAWIGRQLIARADTIRVVSERITRSIIAVAPSLASRITSLPIFVDTAAIAHASPGVDVHTMYPDRFPIILMASRLTSEKQIPRAIAAMRQFVVSHPKALLLIVGEGVEKKHLEMVAHAQQAPVVFAPWVDAVLVHYKSADIFLNTSAFEGYGRTLVEAHAAGLAIVSTDVGIARDVIATPADGVVIANANSDAVCEGLAHVTAHLAQGERPSPMKSHQTFASYVEQFVVLWTATLKRKQRS